jgi:hypothetical protein
VQRMDRNGRTDQGVAGTVEFMWSHSGDRDVDQDGLLWVECDAVPPLMEHSTAPTGPPPTFTREQVAQFTDVRLDFAFEHDFGFVETSTSAYRELNGRTVVRVRNACSDTRLRCALWPRQWRGMGIRIKMVRISTARSTSHADF